MNRFGRRWMALLSGLVLETGCGIDWAAAARESRQQPPSGEKGGVIRVALVPTYLGGIGEPQAGAWFAAFRKHFEGDPRIELYSQEEVERTLARRQRGRFNAFADISPDVWVYSSVAAPEVAAYNRLTRKIGNAPQLTFTVRLESPNLSSPPSFEERGRFFMNARHAESHRQVESEVVDPAASRTVEFLKSTF